ncbi:hypothetical protein BKI52_28675 [marine bacterium AO1-C]|nr:hypothetical protein BKI52_28675 [marine bacterium AO1-C]
MKKTIQKILYSVFVLLCVFSLGQAQKLDMKKLKGMKARNIGPGGMSGRVTSVDAVYSNPNIIYCGTASGGLWKSESGGVAWKPIFEKEKVASIGAVAVNQKTPNIIWVGTGEGNPRNSQTSGGGVYRSQDGGRTWQLMGLEKTRTIHRIILHPDNPNIVYVGAQGSAWGDHPERGVYKTTDGGKTWKHILKVNSRTGVADMIVDPTNPDKLIVALWEFRRWPYKFKSGGVGSGMHVTFDGGKNWKKITSKDGLPKGQLGRMGLTISHSNPNILYAYVEAKKNGIYKSTDGGLKWRNVNAKGPFGNRPFYYADIYVDPQNENRLYSLWSNMSRSEDGGKTWKTIAGYINNVHPDNHAMWIHPKNSKLMMLGNDGGLYLTSDMAKNWRFMNNIPVAQYYHINVDNNMPYHVYGGMQDNGSWGGPAYVWRRGGIRNSYWQELSFGDGFDVAITSNTTGLSMSQQGYVVKYDRKSGSQELLRPIHPEGKTLRFNWNAGIALDPFAKGTVYFGSQYLHKSTNGGEDWAIISPDLTTNDQQKQKESNKTGGLTPDITGAENFNSILSIEPSPKKQGLIWIGTDDGKLQLTRDGGKTWEDLTDRLKGVPKGSWIPQIRASKYNEGEAVVVINNYRRDDWKPYLMHTTNYGKTWKNLVEGDKVWGYMLSFVQDPVEPKLMFAGTEFGLYVSIDAGTNWTKWTNGYPTVSTMDMVIHPREHDLVIGTFGRAAYVLDDIRPLRAMAKEGGNKVMASKVKVFTPPTAVMANYQQGAGGRFLAQGEYAGENRRSGAMITYWAKKPAKGAKAGNKAVASTKPKGRSGVQSVKEDKPKKKPSKKVKVEIFDASGALIRTLKVTPKNDGLNRMYWRMDRKGVRFPSYRSLPARFRSQEPGGMSVMPGTYKVRLSYMGSKDSTMVKVIADPRIEEPVSAMKERSAMADNMMKKVKVLTKAVNRLKEAEKTMKMAMSQMKGQKGDAVKAARKKGRTVGKKMKKLMVMVLGKRKQKGINRNPKLVGAQMRTAMGYMRGARGSMNSNQKNAMKLGEKAMKEAVTKINAFFEKDWKEFRTAVENTKPKMFKDYKPLKID